MFMASHKNEKEDLSVGISFFREEKNTWLKSDELYLITSTTSH